MVDLIDLKWRKGSWSKVGQNQSYKSCKGTAYEESDIIWFLSMGKGLHHFLAPFVCW